MNPDAFHAFLHCLSLAVKYAQDGEKLQAEVVRMGASASAILAFPVGSEESRALGTLLHAAGRVTT